MVQAKESEFVSVVTHDSKLAMLVIGLLIVFYFIIAYILRSAESDRISRLNKGR